MKKLGITSFALLFIAIFFSSCSKTNQKLETKYWYLKVNGQSLMMPEKTPWMNQFNYYEINLIEDSVQLEEHFAGNYEETILLAKLPWQTYIDRDLRESVVRQDSVKPCCKDPLLLIDLIQGKSEKIIDTFTVYEGSYPDTGITNTVIYKTVIREYHRQGSRISCETRIKEVVSEKVTDIFSVTLIIINFILGFIFPIVGRYSKDSSGQGFLFCLFIVYNLMFGSWLGTALIRQLIITVVATIVGYFLAKICLYFRKQKVE